MTNNISAYRALKAFENYAHERRARQITIIEYYLRHNSVYSHLSGELTRGLVIDYVAGTSFLTLKLEISEWTRVQVTLHCDDTDRLSFETVADGKIGVIHGYRHNGYTVDVFAHATR